MKFYNCINSFGNKFIPYDKFKEVLYYEFEKGKSYKFKIKDNEVICMEEDSNGIVLHISTFTRNFSLRSHRDKIIDTIIK